MCFFLCFLQSVDRILCRNGRFEVGGVLEKIIQDEIYHYLDHIFIGYCKSLSFKNLIVLILPLFREFKIDRVKNQSIQILLKTEISDTSSSTPNSFQNLIVPILSLYRELKIDRLLILPV